MMPSEGALDEAEADGEAEAEAEADADGEAEVDGRAEGEALPPGAAIWCATGSPPPWPPTPGADPEPDACHEAAEGASDEQPATNRETLITAPNAASRTRGM
ncbi:hypothetical protein [Dactylosporangium sp. NPDC051541]|uniref:hypothetical protein n=1 Tax=Dactylosporangium sp. NPDC051541 TaxID=3363977 RepID=UPI003792A3CF